MRVFFCTFLTATSQEACGGAIDHLVSASGGLLRSVPPGTLHLTYAFLPLVRDDAIGSMASVVERRVGQLPAFEIVLGEPAFLWSGNEARLVHVPVTGGTRGLSQLAFAIAQTLRTGMPDVVLKPTTSFHVTLARFRRGTRRADTEGLKSALSIFPRRLTNQIAELQLVSSELSATGPKYVTLRSFALA